MSVASYKTVLESVTTHEQSAAESSTVMVQRRRSSFVRVLPDYTVGPPNLRVLLTVNHVAADACIIILLLLQNDMGYLSALKSRLLLLLLHLFNSLFSRITWVSWYQKSKASLDLSEARDYGVLGCSGISWTICKQSAPQAAAGQI